MTRRSALAPALLVAAGLLAAALAGCTPIGVVLGGSTPRDSAGRSPVPQPSATPVTPARPTVGAAGCTLSAPGAYQVADCDLLLVQGDGITVTAGTVGSVRIMGDHDQVLADAAPGLRIEGQDDQVVAGGDIGGLTILGDRNIVTSAGRVGSGAVHGNGNTVTAADGVGDVTDDGTGNTIGAAP
jgi:hypothetical protein